MPTIWTNFIKEFSAKHGLKYACSLSKYKEPLKKAYKLFKEGKKWYEPINEIGVGGRLIGGNKWTDFVKDFAKKYNTTYGCSLSDEKIKNAYKLFKEGKEWYVPKEEPKEVPKKEPKEEPKKEPKKAPKKAPVDQKANDKLLINNWTDDNLPILFYQLKPQAYLNMEKKVNELTEIDKKTQRNKGMVVVAFLAFFISDILDELFEKYGSNIEAANIILNGLAEITLYMNEDADISVEDYSPLYRYLTKRNKEKLYKNVKLIKKEAPKKEEPKKEEPKKEEPKKEEPKKEEPKKKRTKKEPARPKLSKNDKLLVDKWGVYNSKENFVELFIKLRPQEYLDMEKKINEAVDKNQKIVVADLVFYIKDIVDELFETAGSTNQAVQWILEGLRDIIQNINKKINFDTEDKYLNYDDLIPFTKYLSKKNSKKVSIMILFG